MRGAMAHRRHKKQASKVMDFEKDAEQEEAEADKPGQTRLHCPTACDISEFPRPWHVLYAVTYRHAAPLSFVPPPPAVPTHLQVRCSSLKKAFLPETLTSGRLLFI